LHNKYNNKNCQSKIEITVALKNIAIAIRASPWVAIKRVAILLKIKIITTPRKGENITGNKTGRRTTSRTETNGVKVSPKRVFVQMYVVYTTKVRFLIKTLLKN
jgi:hypothetical protein